MNKSVEPLLKPKIRKYKLPIITTDFPVKLNPLSKLSKNNEWTDWLSQFSQMTETQFNKVKSTVLYVHYMHPFCDDIQRYELLIKYFVNYFIFDDHTECSYGEIARNQAKCLNVWNYFRQALHRLEGQNGFVSMTKWSPFVISMYCSLEAMYQTLNDVQKKRFIRAWIGYIEGNLEETEFIDKKTKFSTIEEYNKVHLFIC